MLPGRWPTSRRPGSPGPNLHRCPRPGLTRGRSLANSGLFPEQRMAPRSGDFRTAVIESSRPATCSYPGRLPTGAARLGRLVLGRRDLLAFSPLLCLYLALVLPGGPGPPRGDEQDYLALAASLTRGAYSSPGGAADLWWGPGYPLVLSPLVALHAPLPLLRGLNVLFLFSAVLYFYAALRRYAPEGPAL